MRSPAAILQSSLAGTREGSKRLNLRSAVSQRVLRRVSDQRYNVTVGARPSFLWFRVAKVGTRSLLELLREHSDDIIADQASDIVVPRAAFSSAFTFAFVRDPRTRLISCWKDKAVGHAKDWIPEHARTDFDLFVDYVGGLDLNTANRHVRLQTSLIDTAALDFLGRFERLGPDADVVAERLGLHASLPWRNATAVADDPHVSPQTMHKIESLYESDLRAFGY